jgi:phage gp36-like protein
MYCTTDQLYNSQVYDLTSNDINTATVENFIADSDGLIDSFVGIRYDVPFTSTGVPAIINTISKNISAYYCLDFLYAQGNKNTNEWVKNKYTDSLELLKSIADGDITLIASLTAGGTGKIEINQDMEIMSTYSGIGTVINLDEDYNWEVSSTLETAIDATRDL